MKKYIITKKRNLNNYFKKLSSKATGNIIVLTNYPFKLENEVLTTNA